MESAQQVGFMNPHSSVPRLDKAEQPEQPKAHRNDAQYESALILCAQLLERFPQAARAVRVLVKGRRDEEPADNRENQGARGISSASDPAYIVRSGNIA